MASVSAFIICTVLLLEYSAQADDAAGSRKKQPGPPLIDETTRWSRCAQVNQSIYDFNVETLEGEVTDMQKYKGEVILVINVATFCGKLVTTIAIGECNLKPG